VKAEAMHVELPILPTVRADLRAPDVTAISDFALTPPIEAIKSIAAGSFELSVPNVISLGVPIGLFAMMYPAMTNVRLGEVGGAPSARRASWPSCWPSTTSSRRSSCSALANVFVSDPELHTGLVLYGLAPCIAMVIIFTFLAKGNTPMALVFVALNSIVQMLLIPVYARLLIGNVSFDVSVVARERRALPRGCRWPQAC
jgi:arsenite transporter